MADYFVASGGSNTAPYDTWAKAATSLATALAAASTDGDRVILQYDGVPSGNAEVSADTTYTFAANVSLICSTNSGTSTVTPTAMGTANWIGNSTTNRSVSFSGAGKSGYVYGLTVRTSGSTADSINISNAGGSITTLEECYLWNGNTATTARIALCGNVNASCELINCTLRFGDTEQGIATNGGARLYGCTLSGSGAIPTTLVRSTGGSCVVEFFGCDLSQETGTLVGDLGESTGHKHITFAQCKLGAGVTVLAAQTIVPNGAMANVVIIDSASGDTHYDFQHHNGLGSLTADTSIYANDGAAYVSTPTRYSWKIVTTANAIFSNPYISPWISVHHEGTSAITPSLECVRSGSSTAYKDDEVWAEFLYKGTSGFTIGTMDRTDRRAIAGTSANQTTGALGASDWTGESGTAWFGKLAPSSTVTPAEIGDVCARVCVGAASATVYVDPQIRGRS